MPRYDFECECHGRHEQVVPMDVKEVPCPVDGCGKVCKRVFSPPRENGLLIKESFLHGIPRSEVY